MWKLAFIAAAFAISFSPADARDDRRRDAGPQAGDLRRDVERISREIYRPRSEAAPPSGRSFAAGAATKKR